MSVRGLPVSSSQVRCLLQEGKVYLANRLLGRAFSLRGEVAPGLGIGRKQTVPTLNLAPYPGLLPASGVYITQARIGSGSEEESLSAPLRAVTNIGVRPTFADRELGVETHLLDPWRGAPPSVVDLSFLHRLRDERKFDSVEALAGQIQLDIRRAQAYFRRRDALCR
jgi:riboflavin kinase/FMN adenylyltransferase